ncbi:putative alpha/beta hydrolase [Aspergillus clavatus NRRL 1]|uniref:Alpha/beta hydrolase, putative n=1 Tax=Aspergillus clavatus (strain ATCC 1007 / CBS 513.65 / DSM 816 / NCTC 3887 / NRRL 1 / QM 1276 / 107) TaxID=344612 RepID=A1CRR5_ASPCL|nr:alpha/beta hydrolase, putative [Aspergillus clavatus NRRL 1]EAW08336.1 alpha/beta hydrolase, putative [Aspergillus clavatus NRRL 1]
MASESLRSSKDDLHDRSQPEPYTAQRDDTPHAVRAAHTAAARSSWFPLGYKEGFSQWWASMPAAAAEHTVLSFLPYLQHEPPTHLQTGKTSNRTDGVAQSLQSADTSQQGEVATNSLDDPYGPRRWRSSMVELSGKNRALNEFSVERIGEEADQHLVMLHGYGAGLGFFYKNFEPLSRLKGWQLHALDMLGMGRSTRPPFRIKAKNREDAIKEAEDWFVDALEEWRVKRKIERFTLLGHSLGGYMGVAYALKYPGRLNKLILASPVGIPEDPYAVTADMPEASDSTLANEFTQDQQTIAETSSSVPPEIAQKGDNNVLLRGYGNAATATQEARAPRRTLPKWFAYLWDANISPFSLVRWAGPLGPRIVSGWTSRRFSHLPTEEAKALHDYSYSIFSQRGSGEYALAYILAPGAFARSPLIRRIQNVGRQMIQPSSGGWEPAKVTDASSVQSPSASGPAEPTSGAQASLPPIKRETGIPVVFMYGDHDWMDAAGGLAAKAKIEEEKQRVLQNATPEEREADNGSAKVVIIKRSGHHLYLDGWQEFNQVVLDEMQEVSQRDGART